MAANDPAWGALGLCRKAGRLLLGYDAVKENLIKGKVFLVLLASDASPGTQKRIRGLCQGLAPMAVLPFTQNELCSITRKPVGVYGVTDENLARLCAKHVTLEHEEESVNDDQI